MNDREFEQVSNHYRKVVKDLSKAEAENRLWRTLCLVLVAATVVNLIRVFV